MAKRVYFGKELFQFLAELAMNNDRTWFNANKERYERDVKQPLLAFIEDFQGPLRKISPHFVADPRPVGGSMFRIYRDTRFAKDKTPYKTHAAAHFRHDATGDVHTPGFYLHLEPMNVMCGTGIWQPDGPTLLRIREAIAAKPEVWKKAISGRAFKAAHSFWGESVSRSPKGFDPNHPFIEDLKRKDFVTTVEFGMGDACSDEFMEQYAAACRTASPFMEFLTKAVGLAWQKNTLPAGCGFTPTPFGRLVGPKVLPPQGGGGPNGYPLFG